MADYQTSTVISAHTLGAAQLWSVLWKKRSERRKAQNDKQTAGHTVLMVFHLQINLEIEMRS